MLIRTAAVGYDGLCAHGAARGLGLQLFLDALVWLVADAALRCFGEDLLVDRLIREPLDADEQTLAVPRVPHTHRL